MPWPCREQLARDLKLVVQDKGLVDLKPFREFVSEAPGRHHTLAIHWWTVLRGSIVGGDALSASIGDVLKVWTKVNYELGSRAGPGRAGQAGRALI